MSDATHATRDAPASTDEVRWSPDLLGADLESQVRAWQRSLHAFAKRLDPARRAAFVMALDSAVYPMQGEAAVAACGIHPKHRLTAYHDFFVERVKAGERVIDLGSGVGALACALASRAGAFVVGVEWSPRNIEKATALARGVEPQPRFLLGDITTTRAEGTFDAVVLSNVLEHVSDRPARLRQWMNWYRPRRMLIRVPAFERDWRVPYKKELGVEWRCDDTHEVEHTGAQLRDELNLAGLAIAELRATWGEYWAECLPCP